MVGKIRLDVILVSRCIEYRVHQVLRTHCRVRINTCVSLSGSEVGDHSRTPTSTSGTNE